MVEGRLQKKSDCDTNLIANFAGLLRKWTNDPLDVHEDVCDIARRQSDRIWEATILRKYKNTPSIVICFITMKMTIWRRYFIFALTLHKGNVYLAISVTYGTYISLQNKHRDVDGVKKEMGWKGDDSRTSLPNSQHYYGRHGVPAVYRFLLPFLEVLDSVKIDRLMNLLFLDRPASIAEVSEAVNETSTSLIETEIPYSDRSSYFGTDIDHGYTHKWLPLRVLVVGMVQVHAFDMELNRPVSHAESLLVCGVQTGFEVSKTNEDHVNARSDTAKKSTAWRLMGILQQDYQDSRDMLREYKFPDNFNMLLYGITVCMEFKRKSKGRHKRKRKPRRFHRRKSN